MSTIELQIAERARKNKHEALTNLNQFITIDLLTESFNNLNKKSSPGIDGEDWKEYRKRLPQRLPELLREFKSGEYKAPAIRRVYIPKGTHGKRPLGIPTI
jgi:retron-type reverse transcriptase